MKTFDHAEQAENSKIVTFYAPGFDLLGRCMESDLIKFVEANLMNVQTVGFGLVCDPNGSDEEVETNASDYLTENWDEVCLEYSRINFNTK